MKLLLAKKFENYHRKLNKIQTHFFSFHIPAKSQIAPRFLIADAPNNKLRSGFRVRLGYQVTNNYLNFGALHQ